MFSTTKPLYNPKKSIDGNPISDAFAGLKYIYQNKPMLVLLSLSFLVYLVGYAYLNMLPYIGVQIFKVGSKYISNFFYKRNYSMCWTRHYCTAM